MIIVRPATPLDVAWVTANLRSEDKQEVETASGLDPMGAVCRSVARSDECYTARLGPQADPFLVFGVSPEGCAWMLATDEIQRASKGVLKEARFWVDTWARKYGTIWNRVDLRNALHLRWLELLGFRSGAIIDVRGFPFQYVTKEGDQPCATLPQSAP